MLEKCPQYAHIKKFESIGHIELTFVQDETIIQYVLAKLREDMKIK